MKTTIDYIDNNVYLDENYDIVVCNSKATSLTEGINTFQTEDFLYHAMPLQKLEKVLTEGLLVRNSCQRHQLRKCLSLTNDLGSAIYFAHHVHFWRDIGQATIGIIGIDLNKVPERILKQFVQDPRFNKGLITKRNLKPEYFGEAILADLIGDKEDLKQIAEKLEIKYNIKIRPISYDLKTKRFVNIQKKDL